MRQVLDGDLGIFFLVSHGTCVTAPHLEHLGETTDDKCQVEAIGSFHRVLSRVLAFLVPGKKHSCIYEYKVSHKSLLAGYQI